jgi:hypothetical protein
MIFGESAMGRDLIIDSLKYEEHVRAEVTEGVPGLLQSCSYCLIVVLSVGDQGGVGGQ